MVPFTYDVITEFNDFVVESIGERNDKFHRIEERNPIRRKKAWLLCGKMAIAFL